MNKIVALTMVLGVLFLLPAQAAEAEIKFGILAHRGELQAQDEWSTAEGYFAEKTGLPITPVYLTIEKNILTFTNKGVDVLLTNPIIAADLYTNLHATPLVSLQTLQGTKFGGVIIASKESGITKTEDLKGKNVLSFSTDSAGAYVFQVVYAYHKGVNVYKDLASFSAAKKQDDIVLAVKAGIVDAGFIRTGVLEDMIKKGTLAQGDVLVVDQMKDDFPEIHTTPLYPEWFLMAQEGLDPAAAQKIKEVALALSPDSAAAKEAKIKGFVEPLDIKELLVTMADLEKIKKESGAP